ncbi:MAG TPA: hypothetical protein VFR86_17285 [Burkholderiaceae bacterium]|nr:hypothetical protein [Burkholderiaceae bacterium]
MHTESATRRRLVDYLPLDAVAGAFAAHGERVLGLAVYAGAGQEAEGLPPETSEPGPLPRAQIDLRALAPSHPQAELWLTDRVRARAHFGPVCCAWGDTLLFGTVSLPVEKATTRVPAMQRAAYAVYDAALLAMREAGFSHLLRAWNYFPAINRVAGEPGGLERYRQFNIGRADALAAGGGRAEEGAAAACALGSQGGDLALFFLATKHAPRAIENPRQVSAYRYPSQYGPRSPSFSRAALVDLDGEPRLLISGTASILGHATVHAGDVGLQTRETIANLEAVVAQANRFVDRAGGAPGFALADLALKAYVRRPEDLRIVQREVAGALGDGVRVVYLQADICRADLLVEIEACS